MAPPPAPGSFDGPPWPYALALAALIVLGATFGQAARLARRADPGGLDRQIPAWVAEHRADLPGLTGFFRAVTTLGNPAVAYPLIVGVTLALVAAHARGVGRVRRWEAGFWLGVTLGGQLLNVLLKALFRRDRPPVVGRLVVETTYSFPSGHSVFAAVFFAMLAVEIARGLPGPLVWLRPITAGGCLILAVLIAASRVWLGVHYPTDVLGGFLLGLAWVLAAWLIRYGVARRSHFRRGASDRV